MAVVRVKEAFSFDTDGVPTVMRVGQLVSTDHPAYAKGRQHLFEPVEKAAGRNAVEQATAVPGEQRIMSAEPRRRRSSRSPEAQADSQTPETPAEQQE